MELPDGDPNAPVTIEEAAAVLGWQPALIRTAIDCGYNSGEHGRVRMADLCDWMRAHISDVRQLAGLPPLRERPENCPLQQWGDYGLNVTLPEFMSSRASDPRTKRAFAGMAEEMTRDFRKRFPTPA